MMQQQPFVMPDEDGGVGVTLHLMHSGIERLEARFDGFGANLRDMDNTLRGKDGQNGLIGRLSALEREVWGKDRGMLDWGKILVLWGGALGGLAAFGIELLNIIRELP